MSVFPIGSFVVHRNMPQLGIGKVFCAGYQYCLVGFISDSGGREVRRLQPGFLDAAPSGERSAFDGWTVAATGDCKELPTTVPGRAQSSRAAIRTPPVAEWTMDQAYERFLSHYPQGMTGERYRHCERSWKWEKHELWQQELPGNRLRELAHSDPQAAGEIVMRVVQTSRVPLLARKGEIPMFNWALRHGSPEPYLVALADLLDEPEPTEARFSALANALESIPTRDEGTKLLTWPVLTVVPFLARPERFMFLKPKPTKLAARKLGANLFYNSGPTWAVYKRLLDWSQELLEFLRPHGAVDLIDVQSFLWTLVASDVMSDTVTPSGPAA